MFGYWGVSKAAGQSGRFKAQVLGQYLGCFDSPEEAALAVARRHPHGEPSRPTASGTPPRAPVLTLDEVERLAEAEQLTLLRDTSSTSGFQGVWKKGRAWRADIPGQKNGHRYLGTYATAHEAALAIARQLGAAEYAAAVETEAPHTGPRGQLLCASGLSLGLHNTCALSLNAMMPHPHT